MKKKLILSLASAMLLLALPTFAETNVENEPITSSVDSIELKHLEELYVFWTTSEYSELGYKLVWSKNPNPVYPPREGDYYTYHSDPNTNLSNIFPFNDDGIYYVKVCEYLGEKCGTYSNEISVEVVEQITSIDTLAQREISPINLNALSDGKVAWETDGILANGLKVVWSKTSNPTYPTRSTDQVQFVDDPNKSYAYLNGFDGTGTYYARACEYLGGDGCLVYSNEVSLELTEKTSTTDKFKDVDLNSEYYDAIAYLKEKEVVQGYNNEGEYFGPTDKITRAAFIKIVFELSDYQPAGTYCFDDVKDEWFSGYICEAKRLGFVEGYTPDTFGPEREINFVEASKIVANVLDLNVDESYDEIWYQKYVKAMESFGAVPKEIENFDQVITREVMAEMAYRVDAQKTDKPSKTYNELKSKEVKSEIQSTVNGLFIKEVSDGKVEWIVDGSLSEGVKLTYSTSPNPTYPGRDSDQVQYFSGSGSSGSAQLKAFDGSGVYYVRVCEYLGDSGCGVYSNEIMVNL